MDKVTAEMLRQRAWYHLTGPNGAKGYGTYLLGLLLQFALVERQSRISDIVIHAAMNIIRIKNDNILICSRCRLYLYRRCHSEKQAHYQQ